MSSPFYGQENAAKEAPAARPLRTYEFFDAEGLNREVIEAHFVKFEAHHISFWLDRPEHNVQDTLVLAERASHVTELKELLP